MADLKKLTEKVIKFRNDRDWEKFHNPKDLALSLVLEAAELLEVFQWKEGEAIRQVAAERRGDIAQELADVLYWTLLMANDLGIDVAAALDAKLALNAEKYPVEKAKGSSKKYTEL